jgi:hypothetical protein
MTSLSSPWASPSDRRRTPHTQRTCRLRPDAQRRGGTHGDDKFCPIGKVERRFAELGNSILAILNVLPVTPRAALTPSAMIVTSALVIEPDLAALDLTIVRALVPLAAPLMLEMLSR